MVSSEYSFAKEFAAFLPKKPPSDVLPRGEPASVKTEDGASAEMGAAVLVATHPPLGQVTPVAGGTVNFYVVVDTEATGTSTVAPPEVVLWHSPTQRLAGVSGEDSSSWTATPCKRHESDSASVSGRFWALQNPDEAVVRYYYMATVPLDGATSPAVGMLHFTVKFRQSASATWRWVGDEQQLGDGTLVVNQQAARLVRQNVVPGMPAIPGLAEAVGPCNTVDLADLIGGLNSAFRVTAPHSQAPGTQLWALQTPVAGVAAGHDDSAYTHVRIGRPWHGRLLRWFALVRLWAPWIAPRHGRHTILCGGLDAAVMCSFLGGPQGRHLVVLAVSGVDHLQAVLQAGGSGGDGNDGEFLVLSVRSDSLKEETATVLVAVGDSFESANAAVMYHARSLMHQMAEEKNGAVDAEVQQLASGVRPAWLENWYDGLGFCTWNALGQDLSEAKIIDAVETLAAHGIHISSLIIDDNWQSIDRSHPGGQFQHTWTRFEADVVQFPRGLAHTVQQLRARQPSLQHVAVWHALLGYWGGVTPDGDIARRYATRVIEREHPPRRNLPVAGPMMVVGEDADVRRLYNDFYEFLSQSGVDAVKTDAQFMIDTWRSAAARRELTTAYQDAWTVATLRHFGSRAISCMSQTPAILFYSQLPPNRPPVLVRNSDDFFPDVPASHPWHVWANAHNSLFTQHLNVLPDWDMFQTVHAYSRFHAAARCISGGPIYITDTPGHHDLDLLTQMAAPGVDPARTVIFRPSVVGRSLDQYVGFHDNILLKIGSFHGNAEGTGILGVFNVSDRPIREIVPLARVPGVVSADSNDDGYTDSPLYVTRVHTSGRVTAVPVRASALLTLALDVCAFEIVSVYRVHSFASASGEPLHLANIGLVDKMAAAATIVSTVYQQSESRSDARIELQIVLKAPGRLGLFVSGLAEGHRTVRNNFLATMRGQPIPAHCATVSILDPHILEIDTARAWREMGFKPMLNNEVQLTVYIW